MYSSPFRVIRCGLLLATRAGASPAPTIHGLLRRMVGATLAVALGLLIVGCSSSSGGTPSPTNATLQGPVSIGTVVAQVLTNMHLHSWNPAAETHGVVTGGLFINWKMSDPSITNAVKPGPDGNPQHNHDPQVDLLYLTSLVEYQQIHPQDHTYDADLSRATTQVLADFPSYNLPKGWIYFYLLRAGLALHNSALVNEAQKAATNIYTNWYDPALGVVYNRNHTPGDYDTDHTIGSGAALIDAGMRWNQPDWVSAGEKDIDHGIADALDPHYHLFYTSMIAGNPDRVNNYQAKPSTQGEAADELLIAYALTHRQQYLDTANLVLKSLFETSGLWDQTHGGFFFALDMSSGKLLTGYKETRSQTLVLIALHQYNQIKQQGFAQQEQQLINLITDHFYQQTYHGFFYRVTPTFQVYTSHAGQGIGVEDYFTTEAMGSALDALQQTELAQFTS